MTKIYIYCRDEPNAYQDDVVVLVDGLLQLGCEVFGSCNYWRQSPASDDWLIRHDPNVRAEACDIVIVSYVWTRWINERFQIDEHELPTDLFRPDRRYKTAYLDLDDGYETASWRAEFREFDLVFRAKYNRRCEHPSNQRPWVLGLNARMLKMTDGAAPWKTRRPEILVNFGASHPYVHGARGQAGPPFLRSIESIFSINNERDDLTHEPEKGYDRLMWEQTQRRHSRSYYQRLKESQAIVAYCGELIPPAPFHPPYLVGGRRAKISRRWFNLLAKLDSRPPRLIQWDSWRFWEGLAAGCLVFNFDLPYYGVELPEMPQPFVHYVPIRLGREQEALDCLNAMPDQGESIANAGKEWAVKHYTPRALAARFLTKFGIESEQRPIAS